MGSLHRLSPEAPAIWISDTAVQACPALADTAGAMVGGAELGTGRANAPVIAVAATLPELVAVRNVRAGASRVLVVRGALGDRDCLLAQRLLTPLAGPHDLQAMASSAGGGSWAAEVRLDDVDELPTQAASLSELLAILDDPDCRRRDVLATMQRDPGMVARTLKVANSSYFGLPGRVSSLDRAVTVLGLAMLRTAVLAGVIPELFPDVPDELVSDVQHRGLLASMLLRSQGGAHAATASTAAILMDVGQLVLAAQDPDGYLDLAEAGPASALPAREFARYGASHAQVGARLLAVWGLPAEIVDAVGLSHTAVPHPGQRRSTRAQVFVAAHAVQQQTEVGGAPELPEGWAQRMGVDLGALCDQVADLAMQWPAA